MPASVGILVASVPSVIADQLSVLKDEYRVELPNSDSVRAPGRITREIFVACTGPQKKQWLATSREVRGTRLFLCGRRLNAVEGGGVAGRRR